MSKDRRVRELKDSTFIRERLYPGERSDAERYRALVLGDSGWGRLLLYESINLVASDLPGAAGLLARRILYPSLLGSVGDGVVIGKGVTLRHPQKIHLGDQVVLDDYATIDARGAGESGIVIGDEVIIGRNAALLAKNGEIEIGAGSNIGASSFLVSRGGIQIGESALIGGECHVSGGAYHFDDPAAPVMDQGIYTQGPIVVGDGVWLGMKVGVLDGVRIGDGCVIGAGAIVTEEVPDYTVAAGVPAEVVRNRAPEAASDRPSEAETRA